MMHFADRDALIEDPDTDDLKEHYVGYPCVLVRLSRVHPDAPRLTDTRKSIHVNARARHAVLCAMLRSVAFALGSAAAATAAGIAATILTGGSPQDVAGFGLLCFASSLTLALVVYLPVFAMTRGHHWTRRSAILLTVTLLNAPAYVVLLGGLWRGGLFGGWSEILMFAGAYATAGTVFAWCSSAAS